MNFVRHKIFPVTGFTLLLAATPRMAGAVPACFGGPPLGPPNIEMWPLWEAGKPLQFDEPGAQLKSVWNTLGEFQSGTPFAHSGIDINSASTDPLANWVYNAADGYIWATHNLNEMQCNDVANCKLYVRSHDHRYIYYYAHLNLLPVFIGGPPTPDFTSEVRFKILAAAQRKHPEDDDDPGDDGVDFGTDFSLTSIDAGVVLTGLAPFVNGFSHLHFAILDQCENFDAVNPLAHMGPDKWVDQVDPVITELHLRDEVGSADVDLGGAAVCSGVVPDEFDVIAQMTDPWIKVSVENGDQKLGVYEASYGMVNLRDPAVGPIILQPWYEFDTMPFNCPGFGKAFTCDPDLDMTTLVEDELNILQFTPGGDPPGAQNGGPFLAANYTDELFGTASPYSSESRDFAFLTVKNYPILNHGGGIAGNVEAPTIDGLYQVSVETFDIAGNGAARSGFFLLGDPVPNLVIADNKFDHGGVPSTLGNLKHYNSSSIKVLPVDTDPAVNDPMWQEMQAVALVEDQARSVYVLVENNGCDDIDANSVELIAASAEPALITTGWQPIGAQVTIGAAIPAGDSVVVELPWTPGAGETGHRSLIAAVSHVDDPAGLPTNMGGDMDLSQVDTASAKFTEFDSNVAQRDLTLSGESHKFKLGNPFGAAVDLSMDFDCNDIPIYEQGATITLHIDDFDEIALGWAAASDTTMVVDMNGDMSLTFHRCMKSMPVVTLPANTVVDAWLEVDIPVVMVGTWTVDFTARIDGVIRDGISVRHTQ